MIGFLARLRRDHRGVSAVEFALIAPALIAFYFGLAEFTQAMMAERRASHVAASMGDLVAQSTQISDSTITDIFSIGTTIMSPFPTTSLKMRLSSVTANSSGTPKVDWSNGTGGLAALGTGATVTLPSGLVTAGQSVVMSEVTYVYDSPVDKFIPGTITFTKKFYLRPRKSDQVVKAN
jgi:Flp pilus assembly protein TadG